MWKEEIYTTLVKDCRRHLLGLEKRNWVESQKEQKISRISKKRGNLERSTKNFETETYRSIRFCTEFPEILVE